MSTSSFTRRTDVVVRVEGDETIVLDLASQTAHCLGGDLAQVWSASGSTVAAVAAEVGLSTDAVESAVASLHGFDLVSASAGISRRAVLARTAIGGGVVATAIALPAAAAASSTTSVSVTGTCSPSGDGTSTFKISAAGGFLNNTGPGQLYKVTLVYAAWNGPVSGPNPGTAYTWYSVKFTCTTNGAGKPDASSVIKVGGTDAGALVAAGTGTGLTGFITVTTSHPVAGVLLPSGLNAVNEFNGGTLQTSPIGNVYLQFVPNWSAGTTWAGYTSVPGCFTAPDGTPYPPAWPTDYTT